MQCPPTPLPLSAALQGYATHTHTSFQLIVHHSTQLLGSALEEDSHLHQPICTGLQLLIDNNKYVADGKTEQSDDAVKEAKANVSAL